MVVIEFGVKVDILIYLLPHMFDVFDNLQELFTLFPTMQKTSSCPNNTTNDRLEQWGFQNACPKMPLSVNFRLGLKGKPQATIFNNQPVSSSGRFKPGEPLVSSS